MSSLLFSIRLNFFNFFCSISYFYSLYCTPYPLNSFLPLSKTSHFLNLFVFTLLSTSEILFIFSQSLNFLCFSCSSDLTPLSIVFTMLDLLTLILSLLFLYYLYYLSIVFPMLYLWTLILSLLFLYSLLSS